jgi:signal transduction histidine kinase/CheY-like chemotaxis protein
MVLHHVCLNEFLDPVPTCSDSSNLLAVLNIFRGAASDRLVVLDDQQRPTGMIHLHRLVSHLINAGGFFQETGTPLNRQSSVLIQEISAITDCLAIIPAAWSVEQFLPLLNTHPSSCYAVTGNNSEFLGLLNPFQLLKVIAATRTELVTAGGLETPPQLMSSKHLFPLPLAFQEFVAWQTAFNLRNQPYWEPQDAYPPEEPLPIADPSPECIDLSKTGREFTTPPASTMLALFEWLMEVLKRLPLPLMLQTGDGWVLAQSELWRKQIGELLDPAWVRRDAAPLLETLPTTDAASVTASDEATEQAATRPSQGSLCELGTQPDTCICTCVLKDGQERIWQFIKIPLDNLVFGSQFAPESADLQTEHLSGERSPQSFRLATLTAHTKELTDVNYRGAEGRKQAMEQIPMDQLWLVLAQDITEQQQLSRELTAKNADLIQLNRLKDEFLACISHELKTPLTAVLGLSSLLKDQTIGELNQRQIHYAQLIYQSGRHLMAVVNDILDLTRIETGQLQLVPGLVNIAAVCTRALEQVKQLQLSEVPQTSPSEGSQFPQFSLEIEPGLEFLIADEFRLRQMLVHLLSNALKFTQADNPVGLKVNHWGGWIAFTVWDTGIGIPSDKQHLIFQKFQQLENPLTRQFEGTGLGLVLTQRLARLHGGDVSFLSREGQGSQFTILLPPKPPEKTRFSQEEDNDLSESREASVNLSHRVSLRSPRQATSPSNWPTESFSPASRNRLAMIVEAVPQFIDTLSEHLASLGYRVVVARSGTEAVEKARRLQPCILFLNPLLPMLSGWDVLTLLKSNPETRQIPVIITATQADEEQAVRNSADGFLTLPLQLKPLKKMLRSGLMRQEEVKLPATSKSLTILRLSPGTRNTSDRHSVLTDELNQLLHSHHYRILEADDLEQAELIARVWKPNVALLDGDTPNWKVYFQQFSQHTFLASLPLVTLDAVATQVANQIPGMLVFPCLTSLDADAPLKGDRPSSTLLQVLQIAAGYVWQPSILAFDPSALPLSIESADPLLSQDLPQSTYQEVEWLQAFAQYLQTAGLQGLLSHSWQEVMEQVQSQSVDLLLLCWTDNQLRPTSTYMLSTLQQLDQQLPILVLDHRECRNASPQHPAHPIPDLVQQLATRILPSSLSMEELLAEIRQVLRSF